MATKYEWIAERLEILIENSIREGVHKLPTEQELCMRYGVSRQTVRKALRALEQKELITSRQGSGSYITGLSSEPQGNVIGILISNSQDYIYPGVINDIVNTLSEAGFSSQVFTTGGLVSREREILLQLLEHPLRGLIVEGCKSALPNPNLDLYQKLMKRGCQIVFLYGCYPALAGCPCVKDDNYQGSALLVRHLAGQGHRAIGGLFKADDIQGIERYQGYIEALRDLDLPFPDSQVFWYGSRELDRLVHGQDAGFLKDTVKEALSSCTAILCYNDLIAYYLARELAQAGCQLPADMAVASFDNTYLNSSRSLAVAALSHDPHEMGTRAAKAIIHKLNGLPVTSQEARWKLVQP